MRRKYNHTQSKKEKKNCKSRSANNKLIHNSETIVAPTEI